MPEDKTGSPVLSPLLVVRRGARLALLPLEQIEEVFEIPPGCPPVPGAPPWVLGLASHHGQAVLLLETAEFLGAAGCGKGRQAVLLKTGDDRLGLVVDRVEAVDQLAGAEDDQSASREAEFLDKNRFLERIEEKLAGGVDLPRKA